MTSAGSAATWTGTVFVGTLAGLLVGALTLAGQAVLPADANRLANSGAIWVTIAFLVGWRAPSGTVAVAAGVVTLLAALVGYFVTAAVANAPISVSTVSIWVGTAVVGGPVFGLAGRWRGSATGSRPVVGVALLGAVYVAEGAWTLLVVPHMALAGWVSIVVGVALTIVLVPDRREIPRALVLLVPFALVGVAGYAAVDRVFRLI